MPDASRMDPAAILQRVEEILDTYAKSVSEHTEHMHNYRECAVCMGQRKEILVQFRTALADTRRVEWQSIETAPKDGREVILRVEWRAGITGKYLVGHYMPGGYCIEDHPAIDQGWYFWNGCIFDKASEPMHWVPLPAFDAAMAATPREEGR